MEKVAVVGRLLRGGVVLHAPPYFIVSSDFTSFTAVVIMPLLMKGNKKSRPEGRPDLTIVMLVITD